jgi:enterochelin esterase-like enzyme
VQAAFGGDEAAFRRVNPLDVLAVQRYPEVAGMLVAGANDPTYLPQARQVLAACRSAGMQMQFQVLPGDHTWRVWGAGLSTSLPWLSTRLGLTG